MSQKGHVRFPLQSFLQSFSLKGEVLWAGEMTKTLPHFFFFAAILASCEPFLYLFERRTDIGFQFSFTKQT